ncbi:MAG: hypothetical protein HPY76_02290 [Anaerolineae bacterium]|nr:hypothetical protein [Anaerolineae bacterium]
MTDTLFDVLYDRARQELGLPTRTQTHRVTLKMPPLREVCRDLPTQTAILGVCEDGIPLLLDMHDPSPGSLLAIGESLAEVRGVLAQVAASVCLTSSCHQVQVTVISNDVPAWQKALAGAVAPTHMRGIHSPFSLEAREKVLELARLGNSRLLGRLRQPPILLVLDDLSWVRDADHEVQVYLRWLLQNGPEHMIWLLASLQEWAALEMHSWLPHFGTRVFGGVQHALAKQLDAPSSMIYGTARTNGVFEVKAQEGWTRFMLADLPAYEGER